LGGLQIVAKSSICRHKAVTLPWEAAYNLQGLGGIMGGRIECCRYELNLEELLADEVMEPVLRSAGLEPQQFRDMLVETARRIEDRERRSE
jgi:hypothetical protein